MWRPPRPRSVRLAGHSDGHRACPLPRKPRHPAVGTCQGKASAGASVAHRHFPSWKRRHCSATSAAQLCEPPVTSPSFVHLSPRFTIPQTKGVLRARKSAVTSMTITSRTWQDKLFTGFQCETTTTQGSQKAKRPQQQRRPRSRPPRALPCSH